MAGNSIRFELEALEPRRFLDATVYHNIGVDPDQTPNVPLISIPATVIEDSQWHPTPWKTFYNGYRVQLRAGNLYDFRAAGSSSNNVSIHLSGCGMNGYHNPPQPQVLIHQPEEDADCEVEIYSRTAEGYTLNISSKPIDLKQGLLEAAPLAAGTISDEFSATDEIHWFKFHATADSRYSFETKLGTTSQTVLRLLDADGRDKWVSHRWYEDPNDAFRWVARETGDFYVEVGSYSAGSYELTMIEQRDDQEGHSAAIPADGIIHGSTDHAQDADEFVFHAVPGHLYSFYSAADSPTSPMLSLRDETGAPQFTRAHVGREMTWMETSFGSLIWSPAREGDYRLGVWHDAAYYQPYDPEDWVPLGEYEIITDIVPLPALPDSPAPLIRSGQTAIETPSVASPEVFRFEATANADYTLGTPANQPDNHLIQIFRADGTVVADNMSGLDHRIDWLAPVSGTFFIRVASIDSTPFTLKMAEHIDDHVEPVDVTLPAAIEGSIDYDTFIDNDIKTPVDEDLFRFAAVAGTTYVVVRNDNSHLEVQVLDENGQELEAQSGYWDLPARWRAPKTGTYYLRVAGYHRRRYQATGAYSLTLIKAPEDEQSGDPARLELGKSLAGQIHYRDDEHKIVFSLPERRRYRISGRMPSDGFLYLQKRDGSFDNGIMGTPSGEFARTLRLDGGQYEVYVDGETPGAFSVLIEPASAATRDVDAVDNSDDDAADDSSDDWVEETEDDSGEELTDDSGEEEVEFEEIAVDDSQSSDVADLEVDDAGDEWLEDSSDPLEEWGDEVW